MSASLNIRILEIDLDNIEFLKKLVDLIGKCQQKISIISILDCCFANIICSTLSNLTIIEKIKFLSFFSLHNNYLI